MSTLYTLRLASNKWREIEAINADSSEQSQKERSFLLFLLGYPLNCCLFQSAAITHYFFQMHLHPRGSHHRARVESAPPHAQV